MVGIDAHAQRFIAGVLAHTFFERMSGVQKEGEPMHRQG